MKIFNLLIAIFISLFLFFTLTTQTQAATLYTDNFENGLNGWEVEQVATTSGEVNLWHQSERKSGSSPTHSWYYGQEDSGNYNTGARNQGTLTSPQIAIPTNSTNLQLHFDQFLKTENPAVASASGSINYDIAKVEITSDGGQTWNNLAMFRSSDSWTTVYTELPTYYIGSVIQIRFNFDTVDSVANDFEGWYVDDFTVTADNTPTPSPTPTPVPSNRPPVANANGPYNGVEGQAVSFTGSGTDPDGDAITGYTWGFDFDNAPNNFTFIQIPTINHTYNQGGIYNVYLTVQDNQLQSEPVFTTVNIQDVNDAPVASAGADKSGFVQENLNFDGSASTDEEGGLTYSWNFGDGTTGTGVNPVHKFANSGTYSVVLTITDAGGLTAQDNLSVSVIKDQVTITKAIYATSTKKLEVVATSTSNGKAVLNVNGFGEMTYNASTNTYSLLKTNVSNPNNVTLTSTAGGISTSKITKVSK